MLGYEFGSPVMLQLGSYQFGTTTAAYNELTRSSEWRWEEQERFGKRAALQFTGPGADTVTLPGLIYPEWRGGFTQVDQMRALADEGQPQSLVDGNGGSLGRWVIKRVDEGQTIFASGGMPRRVEFSLELLRFPDEEVAGVVAAVAGAVGAAIPAGATGALAQVQGLAGNVSTAAKSLSGTLAKAADQVQAAVAPYTAVAREALGGVLRAGAVVGELQTVANRTLAMVGIRPLEITALNGAQNLAARAAGLVVSAESASAVLRNSSARLGQIAGVPQAATRAMQSAQAAADSALALARQTATQAATIKGQ